MSDKDRLNKAPEEETCGEKLKEGVRACVSTVYFAVVFVFRQVKRCAGCLVYPMKERCQQLTRKIDLCFNPYKDATLHEI
jgi:hypothetical protein